jgi:hypothetical protein
LKFTTKVTSFQKENIVQGKKSFLVTPPARKKVEIAEEKFAAEDKLSCQTFVNVLDKVYQSILDSLMSGQRCLQPAFVGFRRKRQKRVEGTNK